ncbi:Methyltransferase FkbM domain-containing protein [Rhizobiales bacterium GAS188]|nr:Methyltransferase FkbM domain-containing protein [Rhizobiales bacterium GAS188]
MKAVADRLQAEAFTLVDIGCAGGVAPAWLGFGKHIRVFGFDPGPDDIDALQKQEHEGEHVYTEGFVGIPPEHPFAVASRGKPVLQRNPWSRLAIAWWQQLRSDPNAAQIVPPATLQQERGANPTPTILLDEFLRARGDFPVDFIKIDVDGTDLDILHSLDECLHSRRVLGIGVEVNFFGSADPYCNTLHNADRFLREHGFDLFDLSQRKYAGRYLPAPSAERPYPAETIFGRLLQGDAFYARDLAAPENQKLSALYGHDSILKLAAIFSLFNLPDCAAELLVGNASLIDAGFVRIGLDLLAIQARRGVPPLPYREYIDAFKRDDQKYKVAARPAFAGQGAAKLKPIQPSEIFAEPITYDDAKCSGGDWRDIETPATTWAYAVELPVNGTARDDDFAIALRLSVEVTAGKIAIGLLSHDRTSMDQEQYLDPDSALDLEFRAVMGGISGVVIRSAAPTGVRSSARVRLKDVAEVLI